MKGKKKATGNGDLVPPPEVLGLVGSFFTQYGLESTKKAFAKELKRLQQTADWPAPPAAETAVDLQSTFMKWMEEQKTQPAESTSESEDATSVSESTSTSTSSSEDSSDSSEVSSEDKSSSDESSTSEDQIKSKSTQKPQKSKVQKRAASPPSSSSASDSDADDEDENKTATPVKSTAGKKKSKTAPETTEAVVKKNLKRKAESSSSESSSSDSESDSSDDDRAAKRTKVNTKDAADDASTSETSTSTSEESDEDEDTGNAGELANGTKPVSVQEASSESSGTVRGDNMDVDTQQTTFEDASERTPRSTAPLKKHTGARPTPLAQLSAHATADRHISNAYQSYEYAERAYNDLSVTRGKGFTKEKNKKKRGSYRGGPIDISGGKGFKFDD